MNWKNILAAGLASGLLVATCVNEYKLENPTPNSTTGRVVQERLGSNPHFGTWYRVQIKTSDKHEPYREFVVVGDEKELRLIDEKINVGDKVTVTDHYSAYTLDLEKVVKSNDINKTD